jgi:hypothetical protein
MLGIADTVPDKPHRLFIPTAQGDNDGSFHRELPEKV